MTFNPFSFVLDLWTKLSGLASVLYDFLFYEIGMGSFTFSIWQLLGGVGIISIIVVSLIRG